MKLALVGCGAVTELLHLPALIQGMEFEISALVDKDRDRASRLAQKCAAPPRLFDDYRQVIGAADAAIIALPNPLHAPVSIDLMAHGVHVLVEKPMALNAAECDNMIAAAERAQVVLAIGMVRRFYPSSRFVRRALACGLLGCIRSFEWQEGSVFNWPGASAAMFRKATSGGGTLIDIGVHVLDLLLWWLGDCELLAYRDDACGGVEADCELELRAASGAIGKVELSRTRNLRNTCVLRGEHGTLSIETGFHSTVRLEVEGEPAALDGRVTAPIASGDGLRYAFCDELADFAAAIRQFRPPFVPGTEGRQAVRLIEHCYAMRRPLEHPWTLLRNPEGASA